MKPIDVAYDLDVEERDLLRDREKLGPNARRILKALAERLVVGIPHGDFDKPHDWDKESSEEALDLAVYQAAKLLGLGKDCDASSFGCGGYEFIHGKRYVRFHEGPSYNPLVTLVDEDGRTPDGMPWLPPKDAKVRVVYRAPQFERESPLVGDERIVGKSYAHDLNGASIRFEIGPDKLCRVVPA